MDIHLLQLVYSMVVVVIVVVVKVMIFRPQSLWTANMCAMLQTRATSDAVSMSHKNHHIKLFTTDGVH